MHTTGTVLCGLLVRKAQAEESSEPDAKKEPFTLHELQTRGLNIMGLDKIDYLTEIPDRCVYDDQIFDLNNYADIFAKRRCEIQLKYQAQLDKFKSERHPESLAADILNELTDYAEFC